MWQSNRIIVPVMSWTVLEGNYGQPSTLSVVLLLSTFLLLLCHLIELQLNQSLKNYPPGPRSSFMFLRKFWKFFVASDVRFLPSAKYFVAEYGHILGLAKMPFTGFVPMVVISDPQTLKEAFGHPAIIARPNLEYTNMYKDGKLRGMAFNSGKTWKEIHQFTMRQLHSQGFGMKKLEPIISDEVSELIKVIRKQDGRPVPTEHFFNMPAFNILWNILSSQRFDLEDPVAQQFINYIEEASSCWMQNVMLATWPRLAAFILNFLGINNIVKANQAFLQFSSKIIEGRATDFEKGKRLNDFTDAFLEKIRDTKDVNSPFYGQLGYENLNVLLRDFFIAGTSTTGSTTAWAMLYLALHPQVQEKLCRETDSVIQQRAPSLEDRPKTKYTNAFIFETLRRSSTGPMGVPHATSEQVQVGKYTLPKGTFVFSGIYAIHHNEVTWGDPYAFRPERFLSDDQQTSVTHDSFVPFGVGKRRCPGAALAMDQLFLFITAIVQQFTIDLNPAEPRPNMGSKLKISFDPNPHTIIFNERHRT